MKHKKTKLKPCPFCGGPASLVVCDEEGNFCGDEYENGPRRLLYRISHTLADYMKGKDAQTPDTPVCPIATGSDCPEDGLGSFLYETPENAAKAWNMRV